MTQPIVYVVQEVRGRNLLDAQRFGKLRAMLPDNSQVVLRPEDTVQRLERSMTEFRSCDYLLAMGDPSAIGMASVIAWRNSGGHFFMLKWDRESSMYYSVEISINDKKGDHHVVAQEDQKREVRHGNGQPPFHDWTGDGGTRRDQAEE